MIELNAALRPTMLSCCELVNYELMLGVGGARCRVAQSCRGLLHCVYALGATRELLNAYGFGFAALHALAVPNTRNVNV